MAELSQDERLFAWGVFSTLPFNQTRNTSSVFCNYQSFRQNYCCSVLNGYLDAPMECQTNFPLRSLPIV